LYSSIYIVPLNSRGPTEAPLVRLAPRKEKVLRGDKEVGRLDDKHELMVEGDSKEKGQLLVCG